MTPDRKNELLLSSFYFVAAAAAIAGLVLYLPILNNPRYVIEGGSAARIVLGAFLELMLVISAAGTAITFFPYLKKVSERVALWHFVFRILEAIVITVGLAGILTLVALSRKVASGAIPDGAAFAMVGNAFTSLYRVTLTLGPNFMLGINTLMYSALLYRSQLVPRSISMIGIIAAPIVFVTTPLVAFGVITQFSPVGGLFGMPLFAYEMSLAVYLLVKGFDKGALEKIRN